MRRIIAVSVLIVLSHFVVSSLCSQQWWSLGFDLCATKPSNCTNCADTHAFNRHQENLCSQHGETEVVKAISKGVLDSIRQCQKRFNNTQWNCTTFNGEHLFGRFIESITRETAVVYCFLSAGATLGISEACHRGVIDNCPCIANPHVREGEKTFLYQCNDNVKFAIGFVKNLYNIEGSNNQADLVTKWNNELGYKAVNRTSVYCRCIGLSGSCVLQNCYEKAPSIEDISTELRKKYDGSQRVVKVNTSLFLAGNPDRVPLDDFPVHLSNTPNLCLPSPYDNILGTRGRECEPSSSGPDSCNTLCCSNGFEPFTYQINNEKCKFVWCCRIECVEQAPITVTGYRCL